MALLRQEVDHEGMRSPMLPTLCVSSKSIASCLCLLFVSGLVASGALAQDFSPQSIQFFEKKIRPILVEHCIKCHGPEKQWSSFRIDSRDALLKGGELGVAIVAGKPDESPLIYAVRQLDGGITMPPKAKLTDRQIADLEDWVRQGAPFPAEPEAKSKYRDPNHWAFQSVVDRVPPELTTESPGPSELDRFILARLQVLGLPPAPPADRLTLIRRATFDLTGLPPTPEEVKDFVADDCSHAFSRVIDRLLASPAYGERWGRHWLDVVRYADSNGLDENIAHGNAWRYRDYVVHAFNRDKPYAEFVQEQIAGDLLPHASIDERREHLIATGFLSIGPKVLAEVDEQKMEMDIVDEQIDTLGKAFMGLTLGCARCHDHKFDPIQTDDYYALAGVFKSTKTMESFKKIAKWHENPLPDATADAQRKEYETSLAAKNGELQKQLQQATEALKAIKPSEPLPPNLESHFPAETQAKLKSLRDEIAAFEKTAPELPSAMGVTEHVVTEVPIHVRGNHLQLGAMTKRHVPVVFTSVETPSFSGQQSGRLELAQWLTRQNHPLTYRILVNRVWRWHFGKGLVASTDNFGMLGDAPSHPELLDWLTFRFVESGGSIKDLHRRIMLSQTYQQSSQVSSDALQRDPENRLWSRMNVRRLEAEPIRDALLAVGGALDRSFGGSLLEVKNREFFFDHTSKDKTKYTANRRSIYMPIVRNHVYDIFQLLDYPDAAITNGDRATTTIAPQALLFLNSDLVETASSRFAERLRAEKSTDAERIDRAYMLAFGRAVTEIEAASARDFLQQARQFLASSVADELERERRVWETYCQTLLASSEFIYIR